MTDSVRPGDAPHAGPTPEEISARLEALLKRTHALRAEAGPASAGAALRITWPPPERELDGYDVVDVPEEPQRTVQPAVTGSPGPHASSPAATAPPPGAAAAEFARPDWNELRLRSPQSDGAPRSSWLGVLTVLLALAAIGEAAYIWHLHTTRPAPELGQLRVDGPDGAAVRVDGQPIGTAPLDYALDSGEYDIEVTHGDRVVRADRVSVGLGRTVVLMLPESAAPVAGAGVVLTGAGAAVDGAPGPGPASGGASATPVGASVSDTKGAVLVESTPAGLPVTMGGRARGVTPITIGQIVPGRHDVLVGGITRQVDVKAGEVATLRVSR